MLTNCDPRRATNNYYTELFKTALHFGRFANLAA
jgi:hypothetical protein